MLGLPELARALDSLEVDAKGWIADAKAFLVSVLAAKKGDRWLALRLSATTREDSGEGVALTSPVGLADLRVVHCRQGAARFKPFLKGLRRGEVRIPGFDGPVVMPNDLHSVSPPRRRPSVDIGRVQIGWPHFFVEAHGQSPIELFSEETVALWEERLRATGIAGFAGMLRLAGAVDSYPEARNQCEYVVVVPRYVAVVRPQRDGDMLHVQLRLEQPMLHSSARVVAFIDDEPHCLGHTTIGDILREGEPEVWWNLPLPARSSKQRIDLIEHEKVLQTVEVDEHIKAPILQRHDGSWWTNDREAVVSLHRQLRLLIKSRSQARGREFEQAVNDVLFLSGLQPVGSIRVARRQIDNAITLEGRRVLIEVTTVAKASYLDHVSQRVSELADDARCVIVCPEQPTAPQRASAARHHRLTFVTADELCMFLGGVYGLHELLSWRLALLDIGKPYAPVEEFLSGGSAPTRSRQRRKPTAHQPRDRA